jgi:hypothetical protein
MNEITDNNYLFQLNNKSRSASYFILYILSGLLFLAAICTFIFLNRDILLVITIATAVLYFVLFHLFKPSYFELLVTETELTVNYYSVATALKSYQTIVIDRKLFQGFEIKRRYGGLSQQLVLTVESKFGLADYPPVSVSILSKSEMSQLLIVLPKLTKS